MNYKSQTIQTYIALLIAIILCIILKVLPYLIYNYDFLIGFDTGKYIYDLMNHTSTNPSNLDLWVEPGLNTFLSTIQSLLNLNPQMYFKYILPIITSVFFVTITYLFTTRITKSTTAGLFAAFFLTTSTVFLNATFDSFYRQIYASMIFMGFLYCVDIFLRHEKFKYSNYITLGLLGSGIIFSHRAISLLYAITLLVMTIILWKRQKFRSVITTSIVFVISLILSLAYIIPIAFINIIIFKDAIQLSIERKTGGERVIKQLSRNDNQITGYITNVITSFLPILGMISLFFHRKYNVLTFFIPLLLLYIYIKATFSNRFLFNLEVLFAIAAGIAFHYLLTTFNKQLVALATCGILTVSLISTISTSLSRVPYVPYRTDSVTWVEEHIDKKTSLVIAPDALATILTSLGFRTSIYEFPEEGKESRIINTELFLTKGYHNPSILNNKVPPVKSIYVVFGDWNTVYPFNRTQEKIPINNWDKSTIATRLYNGDPYVRRVYKLNTIDSRYFKNE